ncbi:hypothetical protein CTheo_6013 [Ceratobasidium theobromae]|uniref:Transmembrane protein n=1 Tax=Ceratobasidium theobromae TaxID=1582974 RepID=A0A5N5QGG3_9AGAM|nr:hypothetical protein CTheo_6013 [Ceratobasidium theobromae]
MSRIRLYPVSPGEMVVVTLAAIIIGANLCSVSLDIPHWNDLVLLWHSALVGILSLLCIVPVSIVVLRFADILVATSLIFVWSLVAGTVTQVRNVVSAHRGYCALFLVFAFGPGPSPQGFGWATLVPVVVFSCRLVLAAFSLPAIMFRLALFYSVLTGWVGWSLIESGAAHCQSSAIFAIVLHLATWVVWTQWNVHQVKYRLERLWHVDYHIAQLSPVKYLLKKVNSGAPVLETIREQMPLEVAVIVVPKPQVSEFRASKERVEAFGAPLRRMMDGSLANAHLWTKYQYRLVQEKKLAGERRARSDARTMGRKSSNLVTGKSDKSSELKSSTAVLSHNKIKTPEFQVNPTSKAPKSAISVRAASIGSAPGVPERTSTSKVSRSRRTPFISSGAVTVDKSSANIRVIELASNQSESTGYSVEALPAVNSMSRLSQELDGCNMVKTWVPEQSMTTQPDAPPVPALFEETGDIALVFEEKLNAAYEEATGISQDQQILTGLETPVDPVGAPSLGAPCVIGFTTSETFDHAVSTPIATLDSFVPALCMDRELADLDAVWADLGIIPVSEASQPLDEDLFGSFKHDGDAQTGEIPNTHFATTASEHPEAMSELLFSNVWNTELDAAVAPPLPELPLFFGPGAILNEPTFEPTLPGVMEQVEHVPQLPVPAGISPAINHPIIYEYPLRPIQLPGEGANVDYGISSCLRLSLIEHNSYTPGASPALTETLEDLDWLSAISMAAPVPILPAQSLFMESTHDEIEDAEMCDSDASGTPDVTMSSPDLVDIEMFPLAPVRLPLATLPSSMDVQMTLSVVDQLEVQENKSTGVERRVSRKARIIYADGAWEEYMDGLRRQAATTKLSQLDVPPVPKSWSNRSPLAEKRNTSTLDSSDQLDGSAGEVEEELMVVVELHKRLQRGRGRKRPVCKSEKVVWRMEKKLGWDVVGQEAEEQSPIRGRQDMERYEGRSQRGVAR